MKITEWEEQIIRIQSQSRYAQINQALQETLQTQQHMDQHRKVAIEKTPPILIVDGVWVSIQYASEQCWEDQVGHLRKLRLVAMAIWPDGTQCILHDEALHPLIRTSNALERLFRGFRNKTDEIGAFPHKDSCFTVFFLIVQRDHAKHDQLKKHGE
jgi:hypothetical protein